MNEKVAVFKKTPINVTLGDVTYTLNYDLNAFCELEKMYESIDVILGMILGKSADKVPTVKYTDNAGRDEVLDAENVFLDEVALPVYLAAKNPKKEVRLADTRNFLWAGIIHQTAKYDDEGNVVSYGINRVDLGKMINLGDLKVLNTKIVSAIIRDLLPPEVAEASQDVDAKNE